MESYCRYNLKSFSDDLGLPFEDIADLFSDLIIEIKSEIYKMKILLNEKNFDELRRVNHNIKGISANYRVLDIYEVTNTISSILQKDDFQSLDFQSIEFHFNNLFNVCENAVEEISSFFVNKGLIISKS